MAQYKDVPTSDEAERVAALLEERKPEAMRLRAALRLVLSGGRRAIPDLVRETGLSRRLLLDLLHGMGENLAWDGEIVWPAGAPGEHAPLAGPGHADPGDPAGLPSEAAVKQMRRILNRAPPAVRSLDHVPATAETVLRRALFIAREFDLSRTRLLFAGDHDCTSLAFGVLGLAPYSVTVIDIDERLLGFIGGEAAAAGAPVTPLFADLRISMPPAARGAHDVVFTDPPYTADGVALFVARGVEALTDPVNGQILAAYGYSGSAPALGLKVQRALGDLDLLFEAILPGFNRYEGAEAIGSRADLYRLRPTRRTAAIAQRVIARHAKTLYTRGSQAEESGRDAGPETARDIARDVLERFGGGEGGGGHGSGAGPLLVGGGWSSPGALPAERFLGAGKPPAHGAAVTVVDLRPLFGWSVIRAALAAASDRVIVIAPMDSYGLRSEAEQDQLRGALAAKYEVERLLRPFQGTGAAVAVLRRPESRPERRPDGRPERRPERRSLAAAYVWDRPHGRVGNTWREGLIAAARQRGGTLSKNEARAVIGRAASPPGITGHRLIDLPAATLIRLRAAIDETDAAVREGQPGPNAPRPI
jgi:branched-chain polyamine synthase A-like protein